MSGRRAWTDERFAEALERAAEMDSFSAQKAHDWLILWAEAIEALVEAKRCGCIPDIKQASSIGNMAKLVDKAIVKFCGAMQEKSDA